MTPPARRPTLADVAKLAGTSTAVVSYVVNGGPRAVSASTRLRVEAAIKELDYRKNPLAGGLSAGRTNLIGLLVPDSSNAFFSELSQHLEQEAYRRGFLTLLGNTNYEVEIEVEYTRALSDLRSAGVFVTSIAAQVPTPGQTRQIYLHARPAMSDGPSVLFDDRAGGIEAVDHLLGHGYDRVDCVTGGGERGPATDRARGWEDAMLAADRAGDGRLHRVSFDRIQAERELHAIFANERPPRAIFATTDEQAFATLQAVHALGWSVPDDVAIIGFDGIREALYGRPRLTTMAVPIRELTHRALDALQNWDDGGSTVAEVLPARLAIGETCGCP